MIARIRRIVASGDTGASAVEYGLLVAGIAAVIVVVVFAFGQFINGVFTDTCQEIAGQSLTAPDCEIDGGPGVGTGG